MVHVDIQLDSDNTIVTVSAEGHASQNAGGTSLVCAAATVLIRTTAAVCASAPGLKVDGKAPSEGYLRFSVGKTIGVPTGYLEGITAFLIRGLRDLERDNPDEVSLSVQPRDPET
jgi:uncharacterized protein